MMKDAALKIGQPSYRVSTHPFSWVQGAATRHDDSLAIRKPQTAPARDEPRCAEQTQRLAPHRAERTQAAGQAALKIGQPSYRVSTHPFSWVQGAATRHDDSLVIRSSLVPRPIRTMTNERRPLGFGRRRRGRVRNPARGSARAGRPWPPERTIPHDGERKADAWVRSALALSGSEPGASSWSA
jgi:hypothetical protein